MRHVTVAVLLALLTLTGRPASATVTTATRSVEYSPSAPTTVFTVTFPFLSASHLKVTKTTIATSTAVVLTQGVDYTVKLPIGSTQGTVTTTASVTSTHRLKIERVVPVTQETSFRTQGAFRPASHEEAFDKLTMIAQQIAAGAEIAGDITAAIEAHEGEADPHTGYALLAGRSGGQHLRGDTASGGNLQLSSTAHATKGKILLGAAGTSAYDETTGRLGIGTASPTVALDLVGDLKIDASLVLSGASGDGALTLSGTSGILSLVGASSSSDGATLDLGGSGSAYAGGARLQMLDGASRFVIGMVPAAPDLLEISGDNGLILGAGVDFNMDTGGVIYARGTIYGNIGAGGDLTIGSTDNATKGNIYFGTSTYDEVYNRLGIATTTPTVALDVVGAGKFSTTLTVPTLYGSGSPSGTLTLGSTSDATNGKILFGVDSAYDEGQKRLGINTTTPNATLHVNGAAVARRPFSTVTTLATVDSAGANCDAVYLTGTDPATVNLPNLGNPSAGCVITVIVGVAASDVYVQPDASDKIGGHCIKDYATAGDIVTQLAATAGKAAQSLKSYSPASAKGDRITIVGDGVDTWFALDCVGAWATAP